MAGLVDSTVYSSFEAGKTEEPVIDKFQDVAWLSESDMAFRISETSTSVVVSTVEEMKSSEQDDMSAEEVAEEIVEGVGEKLDSEAGEEELREDIEENVVGDEPSDLEEAIDDTVGEVQEETLEELEVIGVKGGVESTIVTEDGTVIDVQLKEGQDYALMEDSSGNNIIVLDESLGVADAANATAEAIASLIEDVAEDNGLELDENFARDFRNGFMASIYISILRRFAVGDGEGSLYYRIAELTGQTEDEMVAEAIREEDLRKQNHAEAEFSFGIPVVRASGAKNPHRRRHSD